MENKNNNNDYSNFIFQLAFQILNGSNTNNSNNINNSSNSQLKIVSDFMKTSNLITELIELEQQNRIQIELIKRIIQNKYQNINYVNNIFDNFITQIPLEKHQGESITKSFSNSIDKNLEVNKQILNLNEESIQNSKIYFLILFLNFGVFLFLTFVIF